MKVGLLLPLFSPDPAIAVDRARSAEELGFDGVFGFDHLVPLGGPLEGPALEVFSVLAAVAASTERIALGTLVARVTLRSAGMLANQAAALDAMSGGRFVLAMGTGDDASRPEAEAFGFPAPGPGERRRMLEETARACRSLFRGEAWHGGDLVGPVAGPLLPPPARPGGPPIWLGGTSDAVVELAGRIADAWNGWGLDAERFGKKASLLASVAARANRAADATWAGLALVGRDAGELRRLMDDRRERGLGGDGLWTGTVAELGGFLRALRSAGAAWVVLMLAGPADRIQVVGREVLASVADGR